MGTSHDQLMAELKQQLLEGDLQILQLRQQLQHFKSWTSSLASTSKQFLHALSGSAVMAALTLEVQGLPAATTEHDIEALFRALIATHSAAVAPGDAVTSCKLLPSRPVTAILRFRCAVEASNALAFDGECVEACKLKVRRPGDYNPSIAVLLGPYVPDPAVHASVQRTVNRIALTASAPASTTVILADSTPRSYNHPAEAVVSQPAGTAIATSSSHSNCTFAAVVRSGSAGGEGFGSAVQATPAASKALAVAVLPAQQDDSVASGSCWPGRDQGASVNQGKQDEVFLGGLPSHWKAQQVQELLAPYGQLKSLSVAMDAATGKNKGYAFVVLASPSMTSLAIQELDCKAMEGKVLAVHRATDGKAAYSSSGSRSSGPNGIAYGKGSNGMDADIACRRLGPSSDPVPQQQQQRNQPSRSSSSGSNGRPASAAGAMQPAAAATHAAGFSPICGLSAVAGGVASKPHAGITYNDVKQSKLQPSATLATAGNGATVGQRLLAAVSNPAWTGSKQYDVNELYIGDLPLSWDEDAVRRLLGRYGKVKYFTLRSGRDKNFAFCKFKDASIVDAAIQGLHGKIVDGYFLNVRRAIEGKQQQQWGHRQGGRLVGRQSQDIGEHLTPCKQNDQQQPQRRMLQQQQQSLCYNHVVFQAGATTAMSQSTLKALPPAAAATGHVPLNPIYNPHSSVIPAGFSVAAVQQQPQHFDTPRALQQQQHDEVSNASTAPSPPDTPTAPQEAQPGTQAHAQGNVYMEQHQRQQRRQQVQASSTQPLLSFKAAAPQQQLWQQSALLSAGGTAAAIWGAPGTRVVGSSVEAQFQQHHQHQQPQQQQQEQHQSLLQTWDMLSPWSLLSNLIQ